MIDLAVAATLQGWNEKQDQKTAQAIAGASGKTIALLVIIDDKLTFGFSDASGLVLFDDGQCCCESRYMHTDDSLGDFVGAQFRGAELRDGPETQDDDGWGDVKESQFLIVHTSIGDFTVVNYNLHNGYYGGFSIVATGGDDTMN